jgi:hypothetical protein
VDPVLGREVVEGRQIVPVAEGYAASSCSPPATVALDGEVDDIRDGFGSPHNLSLARSDAPTFVYTFPSAGRRSSQADGLSRRVGGASAGPGSGRSRDRS